MKINPIFAVLSFIYYPQTLAACGCGCGQHKRNALMERSYLSPLAQANYDPGMIPKLPLQSYTGLLSKPGVSMNYNLDSKQKQSASTSSTYSSSMSGNTAPTMMNLPTKPGKDPASKLSDLLSLRLTLNAQKEAIKTMEEQLALQISDAVRQFGMPEQKPVEQVVYPPTAYGAGYQTPAVPSLNSYPTAYGASGANEAFQVGTRRESSTLEGQEQQAMVLPNVKPLVSPQMAYAPYSAYSTTSSNGASSSYNGASSSSSLGYQTAVV